MQEAGLRSQTTAGVCAMVGCCLLWLCLSLWVVVLTSGHLSRAHVRLANMCWRACKQAFSQFCPQTMLLERAVCCGGAFWCRFGVTRCGSRGLCVLPAGLLLRVLCWHTHGGYSVHCTAPPCRLHCPFTIRRGYCKLLCVIPWPLEDWLRMARVVSRHCRAACCVSSGRTWWCT